jgi:predicted nucleic-acid-binding protein
VIGLDTNVLVRYIMQDDRRQSAQATTLIEQLTAQSPGFVSLIALVELVWVLSSAYDLNRTQVSQALEALLRTKEIVVDQAETVWKALRAYQSTRADFADCLIAETAAAAGCEQTMTFDRGAAKSGRMTLI